MQRIKKKNKKYTIFSLSLALKNKKYNTCIWFKNVNFPGYKMKSESHLSLPVSVPKVIVVNIFCTIPFGKKVYLCQCNIVDMSRPTSPAFSNAYDLS